MVIVVLIAVTVPLVSHASRGAKINLSFSSDRPLRGDVLKVSGRLSTVDEDLPIPLVTVQLQYHRLNETDLVREVTMVTSNPGGTFEDLVNTTYLLRIGTWVVNASFTSQLDYPSTFTLRTFTIVVQPSLSLYVSTHNLELGRNFTFNGLLFACIPCIHDQVTVIATRPDNTSIELVRPINATGGPYPGGYYEGTIVPNKPGQWLVQAVWRGNDATLPAYSQVERINVEAPGQAQITLALYLITLVVATGAVALVFYKRKRTQVSKRK